MQIKYIACLTHRYALLLIMFENYKNEFILTLTISLQNYCKFKAMRTLFLTKAKIIKITPFNSLSLIKKTFSWIISMTYFWHVFLFVHTISSVDVSKIRTRNGGRHPYVWRFGPQNLPSPSTVVFSLAGGSKSNNHY